MSPEEREALMAKLSVSLAEARRMTPEQARARLVQSGYLNPDGSLAEAYGGLPLTPSPASK